MKKKRFLSLLLAVCLTLTLAPAIAWSSPAARAVGFTPEAVESRYFYDQLNDRAKAIYDKLLDEFTGEETKETYYTGEKFIDLMGLTFDARGLGEKETVVTEEDVKLYLEKGNKDLFNDFCAAKDALDLDHSELWYIDSGYLTFRVTKDEEGGYHVLIGPGRGKTYLLGGAVMEKEDIREMDAEMEEALSAIVDRAVEAVERDNAEGDYSQSDVTAALVRSVHDSVTRSLSYRYETECDPGDEPYIRTLYALVTKQGVCEAYSRAMQVALTRLGVECVLIHGVQSKGTPEDHMWNAVNIPDDKSPDTDRWFVVDATWDDPVPVDWYGKRVLDNDKLGDDGTETVTYLMVGQSVVGEYWHPSGYVSTGNFEFTYPKIETAAYNGSTAYEDEMGLNVKYSAGAGSVEGTPAGVFTVTFQGMNLTKAAEAGFYFLIKMYDLHADGTSHVMHEWYYANAALLFLAQNDYFGDREDGLHVYTGTCEYVDIAVTTRRPDGYDQWASRKDWSDTWMEAYYNGDESDFVAESGMLYNTNASYEAPPYVYKQTPIPNAQATAGYEYRFEVLFDDELLHPQAGEAMTVDAFTDSTAIAAGQKIRVRYTTLQQDLRTGKDMVAAIAGELPFDKDRDGYVDMPGDGNNNTYVDFRWHYVYGSGEGQKDVKDCPANTKKDPNHVCDVEKGCRVDGVSFNFRASDMWQDDITHYSFQLEGLVGSRSHKFANAFGVTCAVPGLCPACYRSQGIDWNLWGKPTLLDAPENLDLKAMAEAGGTDKETLELFDQEVNKNGFNGRLMLVVEDKSPGAGSREDYQRIENALEDSPEGEEIRDQEVLGRSVFEINFNRICPAVNLKPGQSLRVQVGYPAGITYEMLTEEGSEVELKAYHFIRCDGDHPCDNVGKTGHRWGDDIVGVEEITLIPTPYGMVIMCSAFSPFEIVALRKDPDAPAAIAAEKAGRTLVVVSDGNGKVFVDEAEAVGEAGNVTFTDETRKTFKVQPSQGCVVDTVSLGGREIQVGEDGTFTLTGEEDVTENDVLSVTFIPEEVKTVENATYGATQVAKVCSHAHTSKVEGQAPTCTEAGVLDKITCDDCGMVLQEALEVSATGHTPQVEEEAVPAACATPGKRAKTVCSVCGEVVEAAVELPALGHQYEYTEVEDTCQGTVLEARCAVCHELGEPVVDPAGKVEHKFEKYVYNNDATCFADGTETAVCKWCEETDTRAVPGTKLEHVPDEQGFCVRCREYMCQKGHTLVTDRAVPATCVKNGLTVGYHCSVCGQVVQPQEPVPATGHRFPTDSHGPCIVCGAEQPTKKHTPQEIPAVPATCDREGLTAGQRCAVCGDIIKKQEVTPALGHSWGDEALWIWSTDGRNRASVILSCTRDGCGHTQTFFATVTRNVLTQATCYAEGQITYTATLTVGGKTYTDTTEITSLPKTAHTVTKWAPDTDASCTVHGHDAGTCDVCGQKVTRERTTLLPHALAFDGTREIPATCTEPGYKVGRCIMCGKTFQEEDPNAPALGHDYGEYQVTQKPTCTQTGLETSVCARCGTAKRRSIAALGHHMENGKCTRCGYTDPSYKPQFPEHPVIKEYEPFADVEAGAWYEEDLEYVYTRGIILGAEEGQFQPDDNITRVQMMTLLARFDLVEEASGANWDTASMAWAVEKEISDGSDPEEDITREQLVTMLWRYYGKPVVDRDLDDYKDAGEISPYALDAFRWAVDAGIIGGVSEDELAPQQKAPRCQAAAIFARFARLLEE